VSITTKVLNLNPAHGEVYSVQHYVKGFSVTCGRFVLFSRYSVSSTNKTDHHDITEILLKVALNTITLTQIKVQTKSDSYIILNYLSSIS